MSISHINKPVAITQGLHMEVSEDLEKRILHALMESLYQEGTVSYEVYCGVKAEIEKS